MKKIILVIGIQLLGLLGWAQAPLVDDLGYAGGSIKGLKKTPGALDFIVMGDWGRNGENYQKQVAAGMGKAAHDLDASFVIATGDNFYPYGVQSTQDYHWISSFETIYNAQSLHVKWFPVLGNHDYASNPDAQVAYSAISSRWHMPARYYSQTYKADTSKVLLLFIDTDPMEKEMRGERYDGIKYVQGAVKTQLNWIDSMLTNSNARWKIIIGHHPLYTGGWRKDRQDTKNMRHLLEPVFRKHKVNIYIAGHEHHQEYIKPDGPTHYIISGAASEARPAGLYPKYGKFVSTAQGFATFSITPEKAIIQFINYKDEIINETVIPKQ
ncbi:metallophosphoesterase [Niabella yanshanensis]|uniref:acid phosphatase n=1 Tax=Niabella yanshanensis TaxID=577386 RepID=A0ABZ0WAQ6_9BACT|nr:metallophosphoesterase [Niabella yanshanensis]WQD39161.1 metallophosphoesterase [Niabella yanshanensis]